MLKEWLFFGEERKMGKPHSTELTFWWQNINLITIRFFKMPACSCRSSSHVYSYYEKHSKRQPSISCFVQKEPKKLNIPNDLFMCLFCSSWNRVIGSSRFHWPYAPKPKQISLEDFPNPFYPLSSHAVKRTKLSHFIISVWLFQIQHTIIQIGLLKF